MLRTSVGLCLLVVLGTAGACSSKSTKDDDDATAGKGSILGGSTSGGSTSGGTGGTTATGGTRTDTGGTATTTGGTANGLCPGDPLTCLDATTGTFCNPTTGVEEPVDCVNDFKDQGFGSTGCMMGTGLTADNCDLTPLDTPCWEGAQAFAFCGGLTEDQFYSLYIDCFQQVDDWHTVVPCVGEYVSPAMMAAADCDAAAVACLGAGAGGAGAGGAGPDASAGAGGAQ
jgi:hypothetical protein